MTPDEILRENRRRAQVAAQEVGVARLRKMLERAQADLNDRIARAEGLRGAGADSFTAVRARMVLGQVRDVLRNLTGSMRDLLVEQAVDASEAQTASVLHYLAEGERLFTGTAQPLGISQAAVLDHVRQGAESSVLRRIVTDPSHRGHRGVLDRYGESVVGKFEEALQQRALTGKPWNEVREDLVRESPFLQQAPAHWAERIVRTESIAGQNRASQEAMTAANEQLGGGMLKIIVATFDARTAADSYATHGQIRRVSEAFATWYGPMMAPPDRPNDRGSVVPHRIHWPVPLTLKPKSDGEVAARWNAEGRKGSPPPRPLMSTVDLAAEAKVEAARTEDRERPAEVKPPRVASALAPPPRVRTPVETLADRGVVRPPPAIHEWAAERSRAFAEQSEAKVTKAGVAADPALRATAREIAGMLGLASRAHLRDDGTAKEGADLVRSQRILVRKSEKDLGGAEGLYDWSGEIEVTQGAVKLAGQAFAAVSDPVRYAALTRAEKTAALNALSTFVHEELHGVSRSTEKAYVGVGMGIEEAATEILARKAVRELARDPAGLPLPVRQEDGRYGAGGRQGEAAYYGAYNKAISGLLAVVGREAGHEGVQERVERAFLKIRSPEAGNSRWVGETDQIRDFVAALDGVDDAQRGKIRIALTGWRWTQGEQ